MGWSSSRDSYTLTAPNIVSLARDVVIPLSLTQFYHLRKGKHG